LTEAIMSHSHHMAGAFITRRITRQIQVIRDPPPSPHLPPPAIDLLEWGVGAGPQVLHPPRHRSTPTKGGRVDTLVATVRAPAGMETARLQVRALPLSFLFVKSPIPVSVSLCRDDEHGSWIGDEVRETRNAGFGCRVCCHRPRSVNRNSLHLRAMIVHLILQHAKTLTYDRAVPGRT
jgi:hypothetical protein